MKLRKNMGRSLMGITAASLMVAGLAACGSSDKPAEEATSGSTSETPTEEGSSSGEGVDDGTEITMWTRAPLERQAINAVEAYNASHKNQVKLEILPNDDVEGKVGAAVQTGGLPCVLGGDVVRIPFWTQQGVFMDITDKIDGLSNLNDLAVGHIDAGTYEGAKHTLPFVTDISVMVWNKDLYEKAGLDPEKGPTTIDEFVEQAKAVAALGEDGVAGSYLMGQSGGALVFTLFPTIWADGEEVMDPEGTEALLNSDSAKELLAAYKELADTPNGLGAGSKEETGATWTAPFQEGKAGVMPYPYTAVTGLFEEAPFEIGVAGIPGTKGSNSTFLGGDAIGISATCESPDQAWNFMSWLMSEEAQQEVFADNNDTAANLKVLETGYADADPRTQVAHATIANGRSPVAVYFNEAFNAPGSPWQLLVQNAVWGNGDSIDADNDAITAVLGQ